MSFLIIYSTLTGTTEEVARELHRQLVKQFPQYTVDLINVRDVSVEQLFNYTKIIFGTSTWEDAHNPDTTDFLEKLNREHINISTCYFALFGLGDSLYLTFCAAIPLLKQKLESYGATIYPTVFTIDGQPKEAIIKDLVAWAKKVIA